MTLAGLITYALAAAIASVIPGPTVAMVVAASMRHGTRAGALTALGAELAVITMLGVVALGLEAVMGFMAWGFEWIKLAGAAYLAYIGWKMFSARSAGIGESEPVASRRGLVLHGFVVV